MPDQMFLLVFQGNIPFATIAEAEEWYKEIKVVIKAISATGRLNGSIMRNLEPCCRETTKGITNEKAM